MGKNKSAQAQHIQMAIWANTMKMFLSGTDRQETWHLLRSTSISKSTKALDSLNPGFFSSPVTPEWELVFENQAKIFNVHTEVISMQLSQMHIMLFLISK